MNLLAKIWARKNYRIAIILAVVLLLWLASGALSRDTDAQEEQADTTESQLTSVKVEAIVAQDFLLSVKVRGRTEPNRGVDVKAEIGGNVIGLPVEKGDFVKAGTVICELAKEDRAEILQQAQAQLEKAELDHEGALRLKTGGFQSGTEIALALANLETARANYKRAQLDWDNLQIKAPFDGVVDTRPVELGDLMLRGDVCARVLDLDPLLLTGQISETSIAAIQMGAQVSAQLVTGDNVTGTIRFVQRNADDVTRTFRMEAVVPNPDFRLMSGVSADLQVPVDQVKAHLINSSLLTLDDKGDIGLKILDDQNRAKFVPVDLVGDHDSGVWVTGLPDETTLITVGQQYVAEGEEVETTFVDSADLENTEAL